MDEIDMQQSSLEERCEPTCKQIINDSGADFIRARVRAYSQKFVGLKVELAKLALNMDG